MGGARMYDPETESIVLWDGRSYALDVVAAHSESLLRYAAEHPCFEEQYIEQRFAGRRDIPILAVAFLVIGVVVGWIGWSVGAGWVTVAVFTGAVAAMVVLHLYSVGVHPAFFGIRIDNGQFVLNSGGSVQTCALNELYWYRGYTRDDVRMAGFSAKPCIVLRRRGSRFAVACGFTPAMRGILQDFLRLAGIPEGRARWKWGGSFVFMTMALAAIVSFGFADLLQAWLGGNQLAIGLWFGVVVFGPVTAGMTAAVIAGNDWCAAEPLRAYLFNLEIFLALGLIPARIAFDTLPSIIAVVAASGAFSLPFTWTLAKLGRKPTP